MKKVLGMLLIAMLVCALGCAAALADEVPQPEGGKKFESNWAIMGGLVEINYEEEGYRVLIDLCNNEDMSGTIREYSCYYSEDRDALVSVSSAKRTYTSDPSTLERTESDVEYKDAGEGGQEAVFTINENGKLIWTDESDKEAGADLEFSDIGTFKGTWRSAEGEEPVWVDFTWSGLNEETYSYFVYLHRGDDDVYTEFIMNGLYDPETGKLTCKGNSVDPADKEEYEAVFSMAGNGQLLYEAANGILMDFDPLGGSQG